MMWTRVESTGEPKILYRYHVDVEAWPAWVTYEAPGHISSLRKLQCVADGLRSGAIWFRRVSAAEVARREQEHGLATTESRRARADAWEVRHLRPLETRSKILRNGTGIKTRGVVTDEDDARAAQWMEDAIRAAQAAAAGADAGAGETEDCFLGAGPGQYDALFSRLRVVLVKYGRR